MAQLNKTIDRGELAAANINPDTGLATDYLNHFNEVAMLVDMLPSMPDVAEDVLEWRPVTYPDHFLITGFRAKELAIEAFNQCDEDIRARFSAACSDVEAGITRIQELLKNGVECVADPSGEAAALYNLIAAVGGVINPGGATSEDVDMSSMSEMDSAMDCEGGAGDQAAIDALFD